MQPKYSTAEQEMFTQLGLGHLMKHINEPGLYRIAVEQCFVENSVGPAVESLRRCAKALQDCKVYRMTPEWDAMIRLEDVDDCCSPLFMECHHSEPVKGCDCCEYYEAQKIIEHFPLEKEVK